MELCSLGVMWKTNTRQRVLKTKIREEAYHGIWEKQNQQKGAKLVWSCRAGEKEHTKRKQIHR